MPKMHYQNQFSSYLATACNNKSSNRKNPLQITQVKGDVTCKRCIVLMQNAELNQKATEAFKSYPEEPDKDSTEACKNCGNPILVTIFRGGDYCSDDCRKALGQDIV